MSGPPGPPPCPPLATPARRGFPSEASTTSDMTTRFDFDIDATDQLSALLDQERSDAIERDTRIEDNSPPESILSQLLSLKSTVSTTSSVPALHKAKGDERVGFRKIGFGQCGLIFERPGRGYIVKLARPFFEDSLWNDFVTHLRVYEAMTNDPIQPECRTPLVFSYVPKSGDGWWACNKQFFETGAESFPLPTMALITERILPLPRATRNALVDKFCPEDMKASVKNNSINRDCLARVYLGKRRPPGAPPPPNFCLRNFNLHLDQMKDLGLPTDDYAHAMAETLAILHWAAMIDAYDVEFALGSEPEMTYTKALTDALNLSVRDLENMPPHQGLDEMMRKNCRCRTTRLWVLDFNLCSRFDEKTLRDKSTHTALINQLVIAFFENDPYYPLPLMENAIDKGLWSLFKKTYLEKSNQVFVARHGTVSDLPTRFIEACEAREQEKLEAGLGHGYRDHKG